MRNLKRALSLTLASVMLLGMMVVGAGAASYPDVDDSDNVEAIEVLQAVKVMIGDENGNFGPEQPVNRSQMAVVMALLLDLDYNYYQSTCPFWDVPSWAEPYVAACYANGIVSGYNATTYGAGDPVTAVQAASMMMRALGYFQYESDYADGFELSTVKQASRIQLFDGVNANATDALTRNQVAKLALNALESTMVDASKTSADITVGSGDTAVTISGQVAYIVRTSSESFANAINRTEVSGTGTNGVSGRTVELGEQLYNGGLKKSSGEDAFGAPAVRWVYKNTEIGVYANAADAVYTAEVKSKDIYADLGLSKTVTAELFVDGVEVEAGFSVAKSGDNKLGGNGVLVKAYETGEDSVTINVINSYVGEVTKVTEAKGGDARNVKVDSFSKAFETEAFDEEDIVVYTVAKNEIQSMYLADIVSDVEVTKTVGDSEFTADGSVYKYTAQFDAEEGAASLVEDKSDVKVENRLDLYLDSCGYVVKVNLNEGTTDYAYVLDIDEDSGKLFEKGTPYARLLLTDGTTVDAKLKYSDYEEADVDDPEGNGSPDGIVSEEELSDFLKGSIVEYSKTSKDVYTLEKKGTALTALTSSKTITIDSGKSKVTLADTTVYADGKTVFLTDDGDENYKAYTGRDNVPNLSGVYSATDSANAKYAVYCENGSVATVIYVLNAETSSNDIVFLLGTECKNKTSVKDGDDYYECPAVFNGEIVTLRLNQKITENVLLKSITYSNEEEEIIDMDKSKEYNTNANLDEYYVKGEVTRKLSNTNLSIGETSYGIDTDKIQTFVYSDKIETSTARQIDVDDYAWLVINDGKVVTIFYTEAEEDEGNGGDGGNGGSEGETGSATENPTGAANIDEYAGTLDVDFVHGAAGGAQKVAEDALKAEGFTITGRDQNSEQVTATKDGIETTFTYTGTEYFTVKVDDTTYYVNKNGIAKGDDDELELELNENTYTTGTGYVVDDTTYADYESDDDTIKVKTGIVQNTLDENIVIKTGYVEVEVTNAINKTGAGTGWASNTGTVALADGQKAFAEAGKAAAIKVTITIVTAATAGDVTISVDGIDGAAINPNEIAESTAAAAIDDDFTVSIPAGKTDEKITIALKVTDKT